MRIALLAAGSRGDYQPVLALAASLRNQGHEVGVTATSDFAGWVASEGYAVEQVPVHIMDTYREETSGQMPRSVAGQLGALGTWTGTIGPELAGTMTRLWSRYDAVVSTALTVSWATALVARAHRPHVLMLFVPALPSLWGDASALSVRPGRSPANLLAGLNGIRLSRRLLETPFAHLGLTPVERLRARRLLLTTPAFVAHTRELIVPRRVLGRRIHLTGYPFRDLPAGTRLSPALEGFLAAGEAPVYVGFGSQDVPPTRAALRYAVDAARSLGHRVVVQGGSGVRDESDLRSDERVHVLDAEPHELLFRRTRAIVHHGGAGTTAEALRAGLPQVVVPFAFDQPFFARRCHEVGIAGPPVPVREATREVLAASLTAADRPEVRERAAEVGDRVRAERGVERSADHVERVLIG